MIRIFDKKSWKAISDTDVLMQLAGMDPRMGFEAVAIQDDGTPIVCDKCGNFGYIDQNKFVVSLVINDDL